MKKIKRYMQEYISIINLKTGSKFPFKKQFLFDFAVVFSIITTVLLGTGYVFKYLENFNYVAYSINAAVFGSFFFSLFEREKEIKTELGQTYNTFLGIVLDLIYILMIQITVTAILFFFVFSAIVNNANVLFCIILSTILFILHYQLAKYSDKNTVIEDDTKTQMEGKQLQVSKSILYIILIHQYYMIAYHVHIFDSLIAMTVVWTIVFLVLLCLRYYLRHTYIKGLSHPGIRYTLYFLILIMFNSQLPRLSYDLELKDIVYIENEAIYKELGEIVTPEVYNYSHGAYIIHDGHLIIDSRHSDSGATEVLQNEYFSPKTVIFTQYSNGVYHYMFESIKLMDEGFHHVIVKLDNNTLTETYHEINVEEPAYINQPLSKTVGPARIYQTVAIDDMIYCRTEIGLITYNKAFEQQDIIQFDEVIPDNIQDEFDKIDGSSYSVSYGEYTIYQNKDTLEMRLSVSGNNATIDLESPFPYIPGDTSHETIHGLLITDDYYIVQTFTNVITYTKEGEYVDSISHPNMSQLHNSYIEGNKLITVYITYYDELFYTNESYIVIEVDPSDYGTYVLRDDFQSYVNCDIPFGCTEYNPMTLSPYIYVQLLASMMIIAIPSVLRKQE